jgi:hypothetical protein
MPSEKLSVKLRKLMLKGLLEVISSSPNLAAGAVQVGDEVREGEKDLPALVDD